jgi:hypothetical protein
VLELWGLPIEVVNSISILETPEADSTRGFSLTSALYIADHIASRTFPPDSFAPEEWKTSYLQSIGCEEGIPNWENLSVNPEESARR